MIRWEEQPDLQERRANVQHLRAACEHGDVDAAIELVEARPALLNGARDILPQQWARPWDGAEIAHDIISLAAPYAHVFEHGGNASIALLRPLGGMKLATIDALRFRIEECGADARATHSDGHCVPAAAVLSGKLDFMECLLDRGAEIMSQLLRRRVGRDG